MDHAELNDEQLLKLLREGDEIAFQTIYKRFWKECFRVAYHKLNSRTLAEEATQNIFVSLWERRQKVEIQSIKAYLLTSVKYQVLSFIKKKLSQEKHFSSLVSKQSNRHDSEENLLYNELLTALEKAIHNLPEKTSKIYRLSRYESLNGKQIASIMGLSEKSVEYHISQALKKLRIELKEYRTLSVGMYFLYNIL